MVKTKQGILMTEEMVYYDTLLIIFLGWVIRFLFDFFFRSQFLALNFFRVLLNEMNLNGQ